MIVKLVVRSGNRAGTAYHIDKTQFFIGRHNNADMRIRHPQVSLQHCCIIIRSSGVWVRDLGSTNGTYVNDQLLTRECRLANTDFLTVGPVVFEVVQEVAGRPERPNRPGYQDTPPVLEALPEFPESPEGKSALPAPTEKVFFEQLAEIWRPKDQTQKPAEG